LNAQEARLYSGIDGTRSGEELLKAGDASKTLGLLYLLSELGHLAFAETEQAAPEKPASAPPPAAKPFARELPKIARPAPPPDVMARLATPPPMMKVPPAVAKPASQPPPSSPPKVAAPVVKPLTPAKPAAAVTAPPPPPMRPPPGFATAPEGERPDQALLRLSQLLEKLEKGNHFEALGIQRQGATAAEVKRNFFVLAKELHPDTVSDPAQAALREVKERLFARINAASSELGDDKKRKEYEEEVDGKAGAVDVARIFAAEENFQRAEILIKARKYKEGLGLLDKAIGLNDQEAEFYAWRGYARFLIASDRKAIFEETAGDCKKAIKMQEKCTPAHLFLGHMAKALGDLKLAGKCYERVLQLEPNHVEAQRELRLMGKKS
jgi:tetratricopeptide (TPR) repeat protein